MNAFTQGEASQSFLVLVNCKNLAETVGEKGDLLYGEIAEFAEVARIEIGVCVQSFFLERVGDLLGKEKKVSIWGQNISGATVGSTTGSEIAEFLKLTGAVGSLINHSERRLSPVEVEQSVLALKKVGLKSVVCVENVAEGVEYARFNPDYIAIEPADLIGGDISVSTARPELISEAVERISVPVLVGAGIKNGLDLQVARKLGAVGVLVASGVCKANDVKAVLRDFEEGVFG